MSTTLPELPKAAAYATQIKEGRVLFEPRASFNVRGHVPLFSADQMHAYGLAVWKAAIEAAHDAAADDVMPGRSVEYRTGYCDALHTALAAIMALPLPEQGGPQ